jgi:hypothetical protein
MVIINSAKVATDLFEGRSLNYADRPIMVCVFTMMITAPLTYLPPDYAG